MNHIVRLKSTVRSRSHKEEEVRTFISQETTGPVYTKDDVEIHPLTFSKGPSHIKHLTDDLISLDFSSDPESDDNFDKPDNCDGHGDKPVDKGDPGPNTDPVNTTFYSVSSQPVYVPNDIYTHDTYTRDEELGFDTLRKRLQLRSKGPNSVIEIPTETYIPVVEHARASLPVARSISVNTNLNTNPILSNEPLLIKQKEFKLLQVYIHYRDPQVHIKVSRVQLDTQSAVNYVQSDCIIVRVWRPWESRTVMGMKCEMIFLGQPTSFTVIRRRELAVIDTNDPNKSLGEGITVLLRLETIQKLGIDLNYHMSFTTQKPIKFLDSMDPNTVMIWTPILL